MSVSGAVAISGSGVTIFNFGTNYNGTTDGGSFGSISLSGSGSISLLPPSSGTYAGILIFQGRDNAQALTLKRRRHGGNHGHDLRPGGPTQPRAAAPRSAAPPTRFR